MLISLTGALVPSLERSGIVPLDGKKAQSDKLAKIKFTPMRVIDLDGLHCESFFFCLSCL